MSWNEVKYIDRVKITIDAGSASRVYGNLRNCARARVSFCAFDASGHPVELCAGSARFDGFVHLIDHESGQELAWEMFPWSWRPASGHHGVVYSSSRSKFLNDPQRAFGAAPSADEGAPASWDAATGRCSVTFYLYGLSGDGGDGGHSGHSGSPVSFQRSIGPRFKLADGQSLDAAQLPKDESNTVSLLVVAPKRYTIDDLKPFKWQEIRLPLAEGFKQWNAYLQLKEEHRMHWAESDLNLLQETNGRLSRIAKTTHGNETTVIFICPLGPESRHTFRDLAGNKVELSYNQIPGALCIVRLRCQHEKSVHFIEDHDVRVPIDLYDRWGNVGRYNVNWTGTKARDMAANH